MIKGLLTPTILVSTHEIGEPASVLDEPVDWARRSVTTISAEDAQTHRLPAYPFVLVPGHHHDIDFEGFITVLVHNLDGIAVWRSVRYSSCA